MRIASEDLTVDQAVAVCRWYARQHPATLELYDFGGTNTDRTPTTPSTCPTPDA